MKPFRCSILTALTLLLAACTAETAPERDAATGSATRAYGDKSPKILVTIDVLSVNPLNAKSYHLGTSSGRAFIDIVQLYAASFRMDPFGYPAIYFNDRLAPLMAGRTTYIKPLQDAGIKVLLTVGSDWQGIGVGNLTADQADRLADLLVYVVDTYDLDGIDFNDEYVDYPTTVAGSYGRVIRSLRAKLDAKFGTGKLITVLAWGNTSQIDATAGAAIDFAYPPAAAPDAFIGTIPISGVTKDRWCPLAINLSQRITALSLPQIKNNATKTKYMGYGGIACIDLRRYSDVNPLPVFQRIAQGAFNSTVTYDGTDYTRDWAPDPSGLVITAADIPSTASVSTD